MEELGPNIIISEDLSNKLFGDTEWPDYDSRMKRTFDILVDLTSNPKYWGSETDMILILGFLPFTMADSSFAASVYRSLRQVYTPRTVSMIVTELTAG